MKDTGTPQSFFEQDPLAKLIVTADGNIVSMNRVAREYYGLINVINLSHIFPDFPGIHVSLSSDFNDVHGHKCRLSILHNPETLEYQTTIEFANASSWSMFTQLNQELHKIYLELSQINDERELFKQVVLAAKIRLNVDWPEVILLAE